MLGVHTKRTGSWVLPSLYLSKSIGRSWNQTKLSILNLDLFQRLKIQEPLTFYIIVYLSFFLSIFLSIYLSFFLSSFFLYIYLCFSLSIFLSIYLSFYLSIFLSIWLEDILILDLKYQYKSNTQWMQNSNASNFFFILVLTMRYIPNIIWVSCYAIFNKWIK